MDPATFHSKELLKLLEELNARQNQALTKYIPTELESHNQLSFHKSKCPIRVIKGGNQSGKSVANAAELAWMLRGTHPYNAPAPGGAGDKPKEAYVVSAEYKTIKQGIWRHLRPDGDQRKGMAFLHRGLIKIGPSIPNSNGIPSYIEVRYKEKVGGAWPWSRLEFVSGEGGKSARKRLQSASLDACSVDEEIEDSLIDEILARFLTTAGVLIVSATLIESVPWILDLEDRYHAGDPDVHFTTLDTSKSPYVDARTLKLFETGLSEEMKEVRIRGQSRRRFGLVYQIDPEKHIVEPFEFPEPNDPEFKKWTFICALDPGFRVFGALWAAFNKDTHHWYIIDELYEREAELHNVAKLIHEKEGYSFLGGIRKLSNPSSHLLDVDHYIDPSTCRNLETGQLGIHAQLASLYSLPCIPANNDIAAGIETIRHLLMPGLDGVPGLQIFRSCTHLLKEIGRYKIKTDKSRSDMNQSRDEPVARDDHLMDCLRYSMSAFLMTTTRGNNKVRKPKLGAIHPHLGAIY